ncbi:hypothetical protein HDV04_000709 [Boothiomyces sp. JEL0838]|nr:hypothetical protein HDV04_000709 [Boothiomyces sp. JEL0838]
MAVYKDTVLTGSWDGKLSLWNINNQEPETTPICNPEWFNLTPPTSPNRNVPLPTCVFKETIGRWKGKIESVKIDGDLVYIGSSSRFTVLNIKTRHRKDFNICNINRIEIGDQIVLGSDNTIYTTNRFDQDLEQISTKQSGSVQASGSKDPAHFSRLSCTISNIVYVGQIQSIIVAMTSLGKIYIYKSGKLIHTIDSVAGILTGQFVKQMKYKIIAGYQDGNIRSWQMSDFESILVEQLPMLSSLSDRITCLYMQSNMVVGGSWDGRVRIWDLKRGLLTRTLKSDFSSSILCISWIGSKIFTGHYNGSITVWDFEENEQDFRRKRIKI